MSSINNCKLITLPKVEDIRGNLSVVEAGIHIPFKIRRVYYLYDIPGGSERGGHAHKALQQLIIPLAGSFDIKISDGKNSEVFSLNRANIGLYIEPMIWRELSNFSSGAVCLVLASNLYDEEDYYRNYEDFLKSGDSV